MLSTRAALCAILLSISAAAAPHAATRAAPECEAQPCILASWSDRAAADAALLSIEGLGPKPMRVYYASDGGARAVRMVRDANGCDFALLEYGVGRGGKGNEAVWLAVLHVTHRVELLRKVRLHYWISPVSAADYRYEVDAPFGGGLTISLTRHFTGKPSQWRFPVAAQVISIPPMD